MSIVKAVNQINAAIYPEKSSVSLSLINLLSPVFFSPLCTDCCVQIVPSPIFHPCWIVIDFFQTTVKISQTLFSFSLLVHFDVWITIIPDKHHAP